MKPLKFVGTSHDDLCAFPAEARRAAGFELWQVQNGATPSDWKPMADVGRGVLGEWRVIYVTKFSEAVYVLHAFQKKTQRTRRQDIELARRRYQGIGGGVMRDDDIRITGSSGNVFLDLGFPPKKQPSCQCGPTSWPACDS